MVSKKKKKKRPTIVDANYILTKRQVDEKLKYQKAPLFWHEQLKS